MAGIEKLVEIFARAESMKYDLIGDSELINYFFQRGYFRSISRDMEGDPGRAMIGSKASYEPIESMPAADVGYAEEVKILPPVGNMLAHGD
jgi:hypothetical protein